MVRNARTPFLEIARECGISGAAIHQRVKKLEDAGVIRGSKLEVDPKMLGYDICAFMGIHVDDPTKHFDTVDKLREVPEIVECNFITGKYNILVKMYCTDNEHLMRTIFDHILQIPGISQTETFISFGGFFSPSGGDQSGKKVRKIRLTKEFHFEMAHALEGYDGACRELHGHSYRLFVTVRGEPCRDPADPKYGMVMDFGDLKTIVGNHIVDKYDHALIVRKSNSGNELVGCLKAHYHNIIESDYQPTCENMVADFARIIRPLLPAGIELYRIRLHETATSFAEWYAEDNR